MIPALGPDVEGPFSDPTSPRREASLFNLPGTQKVPGIFLLIPYYVDATWTQLCHFAALFRPPARPGVVVDLVARWEAGITPAKVCGE